MSLGGVGGGVARGEKESEREREKGRRGEWERGENCSRQGGVLSE